MQGGTKRRFEIGNPNGKNHEAIILEDQHHRSANSTTQNETAPSENPKPIKQVAEPKHGSPKRNQPKDQGNKPRECKETKHIINQNHWWHNLFFKKERESFVICRKEREIIVIGL